MRVNKDQRVDELSAWRPVIGLTIIAVVLAAAAFAPPRTVLAADATVTLASPQTASASPVPGATLTALEASGAASIPDTSTTAEPSSTPEAPKSVTPTPTNTFARMRGTALRIHFPAPAAKLIAVGFHQASNRKAVLFAPSMTCHKIDKASHTRALLKANSKLKLFQQPLRGRGDSNFTAADCAVPPKTVVFAPVDGVVTSVKQYKLYGYVDDLRLEIKPDGSPHLRVVMIHITKAKVKKGQRVIGGVTPVATVRRLPIVSTINRFVPVKRVDHVHIQVNRDTFKGSF